MRRKLTGTVEIVACAVLVAYWLWLAYGSGVQAGTEAGYRQAMRETWGTDGIAWGHGVGR